MKKTIQLFGFAIMCILATWGCSPDAIQNYVEEDIIADQGGVVVTESGLTLEIPAGAFENDGEVFLGRTGEEPSTVPNPELTVVGEPFTIKLPVDTLLTPLTLSFPLPTDSLTVNNSVFLLFNGISNFPFAYEIVDGKVVVIMDTINWEDISTKSGNKELTGKIVRLVDDMVHIDERFLGIKEVSVVSGEVKYNKPQNITSSSRILLFVHGLIGDPSGWEEYIKKIQQEPNMLNYTNIWTYGYHSKHEIGVHGADLEYLLRKYTKGADPTIHIVAHSMGGLVSRSMIEQMGGFDMVDKLITLGTPHLGSRAEVIRRILAFLVDLANSVNDESESVDNSVAFFINTLSAGDLNPKSQFIKDMKNLDKPPKPYYTIACKNNGIFIPLYGEANDCLVTVSSAKGVNGAVSPTYDVIVPHVWAHLTMRTFTHERIEVNNANLALYAQVIYYLQLKPLDVTTGQVTGITTTTATCPYNVTADGGSAVTARGVCWSTTEKPDIKDSNTDDGEGTGAFTSNLTGLTPNMTYYVRAYATNSEGTAYGEQRSFTTLSDSPIEYGSLTDSRDGSVYKTITIGGKEWMAENLKYLPSVVGPATGSQTTACYYVYGYDGTSVNEAKATANYQTYGVLYNWPAAMNGAATSNTIPSGVQGACPPGWHLPSDAEWQQLEMYLGMSQSEADKTNLRGTDEGGKLKHPGTEYWASPNTGATNSSGFTALPGGIFFSGNFQAILTQSLWWSSTQYLQEGAWWRYLTNSESKVYRIQQLKSNGLSVRCVKDYPKEPGSSPDYGSYTDQRDQTVYKTITIGGKEWLAENLKYLPSVVGPTTGSQTTACYYVYGYDGTSVNEAKATANYQTYGVLYNWPAAMNGAATSNTIPSGVQGACPPGWHLPSDAEWKQLEMYLGMSQSAADLMNFRGTDEGGKLKHPGTEYWPSPNTGATNSSGFTALPGGGRSVSGGDNFTGNITAGFWWSSTQYQGQVAAWWRLLYYQGSQVSRYPVLTDIGISVRCVKDYPKEPGSSPNYGTYTDQRDQTVYKTITIGGKEWMAENLKYLPSVVGPATSSETTACYYVYDYDGTNVSEAKATANYQTYGVLYNWPAAMNGAATSNTIPSGVQGACPPGWHLPSDAEWQQLEMYLGMSQSEADKTNLRGTDEGGKLKHPGTEYWASPNTGATNSSGFTALPGGIFFSGNFQAILTQSLWWSSTQYLQEGAWWRYLTNSESKVYRIQQLKSNGLSVRCVKD